MKLNWSRTENTYLKSELRVCQAL